MDNELMNRLYTLYIDIKETYDDLYDLEVSGRKNSSEYDAMLHSLKYYINEELDLYDKIFNDIELMQELTKVYKVESMSFEQELECIKNRDDLLKIRCIIRLFDILNVDFDSLVMDEDLKEMYRQDVEMEDAVRNDFVNIILALLNKEKDNLGYERLKYDLAFCYKDVEKTLVNNCFEVNENLVLYSKAVAELQGRSEESYRDIIDYFITDILSKQLKDIEYLISNDVNREDKLLKLDIIKLYLRSILLMAKDKEKEMLQKTIELEVELLDVDDVDIKDALKEVFSNIERDRELPYIIGFSLNM